MSKPKRTCEDCGKTYYNIRRRTATIELKKYPVPHIKNYCGICQRICMNMSGPYEMTRTQYRAETEFKYRREQLEKTK